MARALSPDPGRGLCPPSAEVFRARETTLAADYVKAQRTRASLRRDLLAVFRHIDALLTPGELIPPPPHDARTVTINGRDVNLMAALISATCPFNLTGQPALTVPCGFTHTGLPLALQIVGKPCDEATVLRIGHAYEVHTTWHERRPPLHETAGLRA